MFEYCSDLHEDIVQKNISLLSKSNKERLTVIGSLIDDDYAIWKLTDDWFSVINKTESERFDVSSRQLNYMMSLCGPMLNILSDKEWAEVEFEWNKLLFAIRTFNTNLLGLFWSKNELTEIGADGINIAGWKYASYYMFANEVYQKLRPRIIVNETNRYIDSLSMDEYTLANKCMTTIQRNMMDVLTRFHFGNDIFDFLRVGMQISINAYKNPVASNWTNYWESLEARPSLPILQF